MFALFSGLFAGLSLIIAIGAQNAFVIRQGLTRQHVFLVVAICAASDALLISLGAGGLGALIQAHSGVLEVVRWFGVVYLTWFGIKSLRAALASQVLNAASQPVLSGKSLSQLPWLSHFLIPMFISTQLFCLEQLPTNSLAKPGTSPPEQCSAALSGSPLSDMALKLPRNICPSLFFGRSWIY